jgi:hypothetical protein
MLKMFKKPTIAELIEKSDFKALLDIVNGKDEQSANEAVPGLAYVIANPKGINIGERDKESYRRVEKLLAVNSHRATDILLSAFERFSLGEATPLAVSAIVANGDVSRLFDSLRKGTIQGNVTRIGIITNLLEIAISKSDGGLTLRTLASIQPEDRSGALNPRQIAKGLTNCSEEGLLDVLKESRNYDVIDIICTALSEGKIGGEKSLEILANIPNIRSSSGFSDTKIVSELAAKSIKSRLGKTS